MTPTPADPGKGGRKGGFGKSARKIAAEKRAADGPVLQILCRVFRDGADAGMDEWRAWYEPDGWISWPRALGAFIGTRLLRVAPVRDLTNTTCDAVLAEPEVARMVRIFVRGILAADNQLRRAGEPRP